MSIVAETDESIVLATKYGVIQVEKKDILCLGGEEFDLAVCGEMIILKKTDGKYHIERRENIETYLISPIRRSRNQSIGKCIDRYVQRMITSPISDESESEEDEEEEEETNTPAEVSVEEEGREQEEPREEIGEEESEREESDDESVIIVEETEADESGTGSETQANGRGES